MVAELLLQVSDDDFYHFCHKIRFAPNFPLAFKINHNIIISNNISREVREVNVIY